MNEVKQIGNVTPNNWGDQANQGRVYDTSGISPALNSMQGGGRQPHICEVRKMDEIIVAMRGRDKDGNGYKQRLEPNNDGTVNTVTTVAKDNLVLERTIVAIDEQNKAVREKDFGTLTTDGSSPKHNNRVAEVFPINDNPDGTSRTIKEQYGKNSIENFESHGTFGASGVVQATNLSSADGTPKTYQIRVATTEGIKVIEMELLLSDSEKKLLGDGKFENFLYEVGGEIYLIRVRKLTPRECWRLMGFTDWDFEKAQKVNSNTQLYKQAGNSIVVPVLEALFKQLIERAKE